MGVTGAPEILITKHPLHNQPRVSNPLPSQANKARPSSQASAEGGLSTPTLLHSFPKLPTGLKAELFMKHHRPGSVVANWRWVSANEKLPKIHIKGKITPPSPPNSHLQQQHELALFPLGECLSLVSLCLSLTSSLSLALSLSLSLSAPKIIHMQDQVIPRPTLCRKKNQGGARAIFAVSQSCRRQAGVCVRVCALGVEGREVRRFRG